MTAPKIVRLRNTKTNVVVNVPEDKVARLQLGWEPVDSKKPPAKSAPSKSE